MNYPIDLSFKIITLASEIYMRDANGKLIAYIKQKLFKLKEDIEVFADEDKTKLLYRIQADRVIDFSASYTLSDASGKVLGSIKRKGMRSLVKAHYMIFAPDGQQLMEIHEENAWINFFDSLVEKIPLIGMLSGYFLHPAYLLSRTTGEPVMLLKKQPALWEGKFQISPKGKIDPDEEAIILLSFVMATLLERDRG